MTANLLERAAECPRLDFAISAILAALRIDPRDDILATLPDAAEWSRLPYTQRLAELGEWLRSECYAAIERVPSVDEAAARIRRAAKPTLRLVTNDCQGERA